MLVNQDEIVCECGNQIEPCQPLRGWENWNTADSYVCQECWDREVARVLEHIETFAGLTAIRRIKYPIRTAIGKIVKDDTVEKVMEKFGVGGNNA